jgi:hypothetical protein
VNVSFTTVVVRDVVKNTLHELPPGEPTLRVPPDLNPVGPVRFSDGLITYVHGGRVHAGSLTESALGEAHADEHVLLRLHDGKPQTDDWWLFEVQGPDEPRDRTNRAEAPLVELPSGTRVRQKCGSCLGLRKLDREGIARHRSRTDPR